MFLFCTFFRSSFYTQLNRTYLFFTQLNLSVTNYLQSTQGPHQTSGAGPVSSNVNNQTPSPGPYITPDSYGMYTTRLPAGSTSTFISEPYYREYFASDGQGGYAPARTIYGESEGPQPGTTYEGRFTTTTTTAAHTTKNSTPVYAKTVTAAGLTVDLPSPDSGIGTDAITPRDQNNIQQVRVTLLHSNS